MAANDGSSMLALGSSIGNSMMAAFGMAPSSSSANDALLARLLSLSKNSRGWMDVMQEVLRVVPPGEQLSKCKDRRILEVVLSLCEANLLPYPGEMAPTCTLLRATSRLLATRGLYALLPKYPITFLGEAARGISDDEPLRWLFLSEMLSLSLSIVQLQGHGSVSSAEDDRLERAARSHFHSSGSVAHVLEVLAAAASALLLPDPDQMVTAVVTRALQVVHALLVIRAANSEFALIMETVRCSVLHGRGLLALCTIEGTQARSLTCDVLQAVLLECDPSQYASMQRMALEDGALLALLVQSFPNGREALQVAPPTQELYFASTSLGNDRRVDGQQGSPSEAVDRTLQTTQDAEVSDAPSGALHIDRQQNVGDGPMTSGESTMDHGRTAAASRHDDDTTEGHADGAAAANALGPSEGEHEGSGEEVPVQGAKEVDAATDNDCSECPIYRRLFSILCDDSTGALSLLARLLPRPFVSRYLTQPKSDAPSEPSAFLQSLTAAEKARYRNLARAERDRYANSVKHRSELPRGSWPQFWESLSVEFRQLDLVWDRSCVSTLQKACASEYRDLRHDVSCALSDTRRPPQWEHDTFRVTYPQLEAHFPVPPVYVAPLIDDLEASVALNASASFLGKPPASLSLPIAPDALIERLWHRSVIESSRDRKAELISAIGLLHRMYGGFKTSIPCVQYLVHLIDEGTEDFHLMHAVLKTLEATFEHPQSVKACIEVDGLSRISASLLRLRLYAPILNSAQRTIRVQDLDVDDTHISERESCQLEQSSDPNRLAQSPTATQQCAMGRRALELLRSIALSSRRQARLLCQSPNTERIAQAVLCGDARVIETSVELLSHLCDLVPTLAPQLHCSGIFQFILATVEPEDGMLPVAAAIFLKRFHNVQDLQSLREGSDVFSGDSILSPFLPQQLLQLLCEASPATFSEAIVGKLRLPSLYWSVDRRRTMVDAVRMQIAPFCLQLWRGRSGPAESTIGPAESGAETGSRPHRKPASLAYHPSSTFPWKRTDVYYPVSPPTTISYPGLDSEFTVAGVVLRLYVECDGDLQVQPAEFIIQLISSLESINTAVEDIAASHETASGGSDSACADAPAPSASVESAHSFGESLGNYQRALLLHAQCVCVTSNLRAQLNYPKGGWQTVLDTLGLATHYCAGRSQLIEEPLALRHLCDACRWACQLMHILLAPEPLADHGRSTWPTDSLREHLTAGSESDGICQDERANSHSGTLDIASRMRHERIASCLTFRGCYMLIQVLESLVAQVTASMAAVCGFESYGGWLSTAHTPVHSNCQRFCNTVDALEQHSTARGGQGAIRLLSNVLDSLSVLLANENGCEQSQMQPRLASLLGSLLLIPHGSSGGNVTDNELRSWHCLGRRALTCMLCLVTSQMHVIEMVNCGVPLLLVRLCASKSANSTAASAEDDGSPQFTAHLAATLLGILSRTLSPSLRSKMGSRDAVSSNVAAEMLDWLRQLMPAALVGSLRSPQLFLTLIHEVSCKPTLIWTTSMLETLRTHICTEMSIFATQVSTAADNSSCGRSEPGEQVLKHWHKSQGPVYKDLQGEVKVGGVYLRVFVANYGHLASNEPKFSTDASPHLEKEIGVSINGSSYELLHALMADIIKECGCSPSEKAAPPSLLLKVDALATLLIRAPELLVQQSRYEAQSANTIGRHDSESKDSCDNKTAGKGEPESTIKYLQDCAARLLNSRNEQLLLASLPLCTAIIRPAVDACSGIDTLYQLEGSLLTQVTEFAVQIMNLMHYLLSQTDYQSSCHVAAIEVLRLAIRLDSCEPQLDHAYRCWGDQAVGRSVVTSVAQSIIDSGLILSVLHRLLMANLTNFETTAHKSEGEAISCATTSRVGADELDVPVALVHFLRALLLHARGSARTLAQRILEACFAIPFIEELTHCDGVAQDGINESRESALRVIAWIDADHATPLLTWNTVRREQVLAAIEGELLPMRRSFVESRENDAETVAAASIKWDVDALFRRFKEIDTEALKVGGIFVRAFVADEGKHTFKSLEASSAFLRDLLDEIWHRVNSSKATTDGSSTIVAELFDALKLLLASSSALLRQPSCYGAIPVVFAALQTSSRLRLDVLTFDLVRMLCGGPSCLTSRIAGVHMLMLFSLCETVRTESCAKSILLLFQDLVSTAPSSVATFLHSGCLIPLLLLIFGADGTSRAFVDFDVRVCAARLLSVLTNDSRVGAEISHCVCSMLTSRFRMMFEAPPEAFLRFFDADHTVGALQWDASRRHELRECMACEVLRLLNAEILWAANVGCLEMSVDENNAAKAAASVGAARRRVVEPPQATPSETWLDSRARIEACWIYTPSPS